MIIENGDLLALPLWWSSCAAFALRCATAVTDVLRVGFFLLTVILPRVDFVIFALPLPDLLLPRVPFFVYLRVLRLYADEERLLFSSYASAFPSLSYE